MELPTTWLVDLEMTARPSCHGLLRAKLLVLAASGLVACPFCTGEPMSTADGTFEGYPVRHVIPTGNTPWRMTCPHASLGRRKD